MDRGQPSITLADDLAGLVEQHVEEVQHGIGGVGVREDARVRRQANDGAQDDQAEPQRLVARFPRCERPCAG